jgi:preprotein translocase subunit SecD
VAINPHNRKPLKILSALAAVIIGLYALLFSVVTWGDAQWAPKLGLDLDGGTQLVLKPVLVGNAKVTKEQLTQARDIIVQRVDANGVAGAEVTTRNNEDIVISVPGKSLDKTTEDAIRKSSQMRFRPVLALAPGTNQPTPTGTATGTATGAPTGTAAPGSEVPSTTGSTTGSTTKAKSGLPGAFVNGTTEPTPSGTATGAPTGTPTGTPTGSGKPQNGSDLAWITDDISKAFQALDCSDPDATDKIVDDPAKPLVTCSDDGAEKYVLGPVTVNGDQIKDAAAGYRPLSNGQPSSTVEITLSFKSEGTKAYAEASKRMVSLESPRNQMAATLDSRVIVAPYFQAAILNGEASISGNFTIDSARDLANQLKFGALPLSFTLQTRDQISPTLGSEQLQMGLVAGIIGFVLVFLYSLAQYRALGLVTVLSIVIAALLTYVAIALLGWSHNFRLDMAGVTGLIVAIGVTADSFIVYFERIRDEVREGRPLRAAVDTGWRRARRTILAADGVNFLAAVVLYLLASSNVRGFAFTLGLTTVIDLLIVVLFTHPLVALLSGTKFFGGGHKMSGLDPERLGAKAQKPRYAGRGRVAMPTTARTAAMPTTAQTASDGSAL